MKEGHVHQVFDPNVLNFKLDKMMPTLNRINLRSTSQTRFQGFFHITSEMLKTRRKVMKFDIQIKITNLNICILYKHIHFLKKAPVIAASATAYSNLICTVAPTRGERHHI